jgi:amino acid permease
MKTAVLWGTVIIGLCYSAVGGLGYAAYGNKIAGNIIQSKLKVVFSTYFIQSIE